MQSLVVATEDALSEAVMLRILTEFPSIIVGACLRRGGNGYLRSNMSKFCEAARKMPLLVLTDLDTFSCPQALRAQWLSRLHPPPGLLLRVAVREIEAWVLADHDAIMSLMGKVVKSRLPDQPDAAPDPKQSLLTLARRAPRDVRIDRIAERGAIARQGVGYNARLCALIRETWNPHRAAERSPSLHRAIRRIGELAGEATG